MPKAVLDPGLFLDRFHLTEELGQGAFSTVYLARDPARDDGPVALKVLREGSGTLAGRLRFQREAAVMAGLSHPHVVRFHEAGASEKVCWICMEFLRGRTLREELDLGPFSVEQAVSMAGQVADALSTVHRQGIVHRLRLPARELHLLTRQRLLSS